MLFPGPAETRLKNGSCDDEPQDAKRADARRAPSGGKTGSKVLTGDDLKKTTSRLRGVGDGVGFRMTLHFFILALFSIPALSCVVAPFLKPVR
jgi:hypothetical protein